MGQNSLDQRVKAVKKRLEALTVEQREDSAGIRDELSAILAELREVGEALHRQSEDQREGRMANSLLRSLIDVMPVGVIICDGDGAILMNNPAAESILDGRVVGDVRRPTHVYTSHRPDGSPFPTGEMPLVQAMEEGKVVRDVEILIRRQDGEERVILAAAAPVKDEAGDMISGVTVFQDITEQMQARQRSNEMAAALEREWNLLQTVMENTRAHLAYLDPQFNFVWVNSTYAQGSGYSSEELIGRNHFELFPHAENQAIFERARDMGQMVEFHAKPFEYPDRPDLGVTYWDWTLEPVKDESGAVQGLVLSLVNETERIRAEEALQVSEERYRQLIENLQEGIWVIDKNGYTTFVNHRMAEMLGCTVDEMVGQHLFSFMDEQGVEICKHNLERRRQGISEEHEFEFLRKDGARVYTFLATSPLTDKDGNYAGALAGVQDITWRRQVEEEARQRSEFLASVLESVTNPFYVIDANDYTIKMANSATAVFGDLSKRTTCHALTHRRERPCKDAEHPCPLEEVKRTKKPAVVVHTHCYDEQGEARVFEVRGYPIFDEAGNVVQMIEYSLDITERRCIEEALEQRNRDLVLLSRLGHELTATRDVDQVVEQVLKAVPTLIASDGGLVWLWDEEHSGWLVCKAALFAGSLIFPEELHLRPGEGIAGWVSQHGESVVIPRTQEDARFSPVTDVQLGFQVHSMLAVPLKARDRIIGTLVVINRLDGDFEAHDAVLVETLAASAAIAIENALLQEHAAQAAVAAERGRLARDLHDAVSQTLFSASVIAESLPRLWERDPATVRQGLDQLHQLTRGALAEMRTLLLELRPAALAKAELSDLLRQLTDVVATRTGATVSLSVEEAASPPSEAKTVLYRIAQEALNNVVKYARATQIAVTLCCQPGSVTLLIRDNGCGFDPAQITPGHLGLSIMHERAASVGATLQVTSQVGQGTTVKVVWSEAQQIERSANE